MRDGEERADCETPGAARRWAANSCVTGVGAGAHCREPDSFSACPGTVSNHAGLDTQLSGGLSDLLKHF
jgi:hypothetical protein